MERLAVKRNYKYKTVRADIRLTKEMEKIFIEVKYNNNENERQYFFRMFDANHATIATKDIKRRYSWQAVKKLDDKECGASEFKIIKDHIEKFGAILQKLSKLTK